MAAKTTSPPSPPRRIRMKALLPNELPEHSGLASLQNNGQLPEVNEFLQGLFSEADQFINNYLPTKFKVKSKNKQSPPSTATVELFANDLPASVSGHEDEAWFARRSVHENAVKPGTASWDEFDEGLRVFHSNHEAEYTPSVKEAHLVLDWMQDLRDPELALGGWNGIVMEIRQMVHGLPSMLQDRVFTVLVVTAKRENEFFVIQVPVETKVLKDVKYGHDRSSHVHGMYCSIEHARLIQDSTKVEWRMATASDAKGSLPMWMQKMGVPGAVVKDVGLFMDWIKQRRS